MTNYTVIDKKTVAKKFGVWPFTETISTAIDLVNMGKGEIGISYDAVYSGVKSGHVKGGPIIVTGNVVEIVNEMPKVEVIISNFNKANNRVSMYITITADIPVIGTQTLLDEGLEGAYG